MLKRKSLKTGLLIAILMVLFSSIVMAEDLVDSNIPDSWYEGHKTASEYGITEFHQSPMLKKRVDSGELPPVEERLPENPLVIEPYSEIGKYGGTVDLWATNLTWEWPPSEAWAVYKQPPLARAIPSGKDVIPFLARGWDYSDDKKTFILNLRQGVKWSDGNNFDADDFIYWWQHVANNKDLHPIPPEKWSPPLIGVEKIDQYTVAFKSKNPMPIKHKQLHQWDWGTNIPSHYMKQFHIDFRNKKELNKETEKAGFDNWYKYYQYMNTEDYPDRRRPTLRPYVTIERTANYIIAERNPYYPFVDPQGNQLPYVDRIKIKLAQTAEMAATKAVTGEATIASYDLKEDEIPLYKKNEQKGNYHTFIYSSSDSNKLTLFLNFNHKNAEIQNIFRNFDFRKALSYSINREEINDKVFFGKAVVRQATVPPSSSYFKSEFAKAYIDYNPTRSKQLLDELGIKDINNDGYRELPDGNKFELELFYTTSGIGAITPVLELIKGYFQNIGISIQLKQVNYELWIERMGASDYDMSFWVMDQVYDITFPFGCYLFAPIRWASYTPWPEWVYWYQSGGESGEEPPAKVKELIDLAEKMRFGLNEEDRIEAGTELVRSQAENLWTIGTVGFSPKPIVIKNNFHNIPKTALYGNDLNWIAHLYPSQFYLESE